MRVVDTGSGENWSVPCVLLIAFLAAAPAESQRDRAPIAILTQDTTGGTDDFYQVDLANGSLSRFDRLRRDPLAIRSQRLRQNLFQEIGRPTDQPAGIGEVLLGPIRSSDLNVRAALFVETSTGYVAYFDQLGKGGVFGRISTLIGRPFGPIAAADGNFALLMRHDGNGRCQGAYLYHASSGRGLFLADIVKLELDAEAAAAPGFPRLSGRVSAVELQASEWTTGYLIADSADGSLRFLDLNESGRLSVRSSPVGLFPTFAAEAANATSARFVSTPIRNNDETTTHVLFVDAATGDVAILEGVDDREARPVMRKVAANLYGALGLRASTGLRNLTAVSGRSSSGATSGVWLIDHATRAVAFVEAPETPASTAVRRVVVGN